MTKRLTNDEIKDILMSIDPETKRLPPGLRDFARAIESAVLERSEQEPVAWICGDNDSYSRDHKRVEKWRIHGGEVIPLYAAPQAVNQRLLDALKMLLSYTKSCEGLLNCKPAGQISIAVEAITAAERGEAGPPTKSSKIEKP